MNVKLYLFYNTMCKDAARREDTALSSWDAAGSSLNGIIPRRTADSGRLGFATAAASAATSAPRPD